MSDYSKCEYCHGMTHTDKRGNCYACGAQKRHEENERLYSFGDRQAYIPTSTNFEYRFVADTDGLDG